ncbi:MAG: Endonuclease/exonuclease/phosphatase [Gammaproteobacteria bacterium]|jgi:endonuclease/exonuclease/phosphatase family metal-dependent hydrolase|nr:Endonuclease/exonuclease/phosphatase [Gammaproteobacteria bacterium]
MSKKNTFNILTYNIHKGFSSTGIRYVLHQIKESIDHLNPHILFLQEIQGEHVKRAKKHKNWVKEHQAEFLANGVWEHFVYGKNAIYDHGHHGNAILSKFPFIIWENIDVSFHKKASRSLLHGVIHIPGQPEIHVVCVHLGLFTIERDKQLATLCDRIQSHVPEYAPLIIAGDFNDWTQRAERYMESHLCLQEAFKVLTGKHARSFPIWRPTLQVDRVYFRGVDVVGCDRLHQMPWSKLSDHAPLHVEFALSASRA